jgi:signal transduction histidine kinase/ActR/RegA family two-component response regulator
MSADDSTKLPATPALPPEFRRLVIRAIVLPLILALLIAGVFVWQVFELLQADAAIGHSDQVIAQAHLVQTSLIDMETGLRAYVLTGQAMFLQPYDAVQQSIAADTQHLADLAMGSPGQGDRVRILMDRSKAWQDYAVDIRRRVEHGDSASAIAATGQGKELMDSIRQQASQIVDTETGMRDGQATAAHMMALRVVAGSAGVCVVCGLLLAFVSRRHLFAVARTYTRALEIAEASEREKTRLLASERAARSTAEHASSMKDEFLATLSHELRTPLNAIVGWSKLLNMEKDRKPEDVDQGLEAIERNARVQTQLIEDLLDMSRIISGKLRLDVQRIKPISFIEAAIETVLPAAQAKGIRIEKILDPHCGPVSGDPNRMQQVIWNLLSNAVKFTPKGGKVQVVLERVNSHLEISVADTGAGINPQFLPYVFDRFRQADASTTRRYGGLGLGLAIVRQLVELHGGTVKVKSPGEGHGATFIVNLPVAVAHVEAGEARIHPQAASSPPDEVLPTSLAGLRVLVVDDEPDARTLLKRLLEGWDAEVLSAASAAEALAMIESSRPDVLVSDIGMPDVDGYEFLKRVRALGEARGGTIPAIALTASARSEDRTRTLMAGYQVHVAKPVEPGELIATVASVAGRTNPLPAGQSDRARN